MHNAKTPLRCLTICCSFAFLAAAGPLRAHAPYDLVLADPPWAQVEAAMRALAKLLPALRLPAGGRLLVEHSAREALSIPEAFPLVRSWARSWGDTAVSMFSAPTPGKG